MIPNELQESDASLRQRIDAITFRVQSATLAAGRDPESVTITAVSKTFERDVVDQAYRLGLSNFGESRVQEAREKFASDLPGDMRLSMIGQLQTNKVRQALAVFDRIESVDRESLIDTLGKESARLDTLTSVLLQVNIGREPQKSGCMPEDAAALVERILLAPHLRLDGLMGIAPLGEDAEEARPCFRLLRELRDDLQRTHDDLSLEVLSMGMSGDFEVAIAEGATHVRIGRSIFGSR